ncbi:MAG TPA: PEP/pyruvate-binding domain-containing protein, partial [Anaerolineales bacterium]|nr:PEP/pyruvate-binding domain-containing protein [Anaerolineales bacterium]
MSQETLPQSPKRYVISLNDLQPKDAQRVGMKAARLAELLQAGFPVPHGFVLTLDAFEEAVGQHGGESATPPDLPAAWQQALRAAMTAFQDFDVAVRSSAAAEDLPGASFAGQYETILNVRGVDAALRAVQRCWDSAADPRAALYQARRSAGDTRNMAVLVQRMVAAEAAGVAFSANPVTGNRGECVINAVRGLGERLVSGQATPDEWLVAGDTARPTRSVEGAIDRDQARALAELARKVEAHFEQPQDIEWAIADGVIHLLQARPITALADPPARDPYAFPHIPDPAASSLTWEWDDEHSATPMTPLMGDAVQLVWTGGSAHRARWLGIPYIAEYRWINGYAYYAEHFLEPDHQQVAEKVRQAKRAQAPGMQKYWEEQVWPAFSETYRWLQELPLDTMPLGELAAAWEQYWERGPRLMGLHYMVSTIVYQVLEDFLELYARLFPYESAVEALALFQASSDELSRVAQDLLALAKYARGLRLASRISEEDPRAALESLSSVPSGKRFLRRFQRFLIRHGHLGQLSIDFLSPSWSDNPERVLVEVRKHLHHRGPSPFQKRARLRAEARARERRKRKELGGRPADLKLFDESVALVRSVARFKEDHNYWLDRMLQAHTRRFFTGVGQRAAAAGILAEAEDIAFLHAAEVPALLRNPRPMQAVVLERKQRHSAWAAATHPKFLGRAPEDGAQPDVTPAVEPASPTLLRGTGACAGTAVGPARVVVSSADFGRVQRGDVLVCPSPNPSWIALYSVAAGLVTDTGGILSHAAVIAREFGVPAVVGTGDATRR